MQDYKIDYHIHTIYSDGMSSPASIVRQAKELGYDEIAITDHDNTDGLNDAMVAAEALDMRVIPGIEIAAETEEGIGLHILGYRFDSKDEGLREFLDRLILRRENRNERLLKALREMGYDISEEDLEVGKNRFIGKLIIARAMVEKGYIENTKQAYSEEILSSPKCLAIRKGRPATAETIQVIAKAGGIPVLAHPIQTTGIGLAGSGEFYENIGKIIARLKKEGLRGLECYHPDQDAEQSARFVDLAEKYHLHITRGSDFHGTDFAQADPTADYR